MPKNKKKRGSKLDKLFSTLGPTSARGKMFLFVLTFAVLGGGYLAFKSFAATAPPLQFQANVYYDNIKAAGDSYVGDVQCLSSGAKTGLGVIANCMQLHRDGRGRMGWFSVNNKTFSPRTSWLKYYYAKTNIFKCANMDYYFASPDSLQTGYGPTGYGQIYRKFSYKDGRTITSVWQIKWANRNHINGNCYLEDSTWYNVSSFDNILTN